MKKHFALLLLLFPVFALTLPGCIKDKCRSTYHYTYYVPVYRTVAEVRANIRSNAPQQIERPGKIYVRGNYIFLNEIDKGIHVIDNTNPASPVNKAFITIPGNMDLAVKGNILYADLYTDLVAIDISNPLNVAVTKTVDGVFPFRYYGSFVADRNQVIAEWVKRDTVVTEDCNGGGFRLDDGRVFIQYAANSSGSKSTASVAPYGVGGSMARFTIVENRLYTVSNTELNVFNIANATQPSFTQKKNIGWNIETIYPFKDKLFIGSSIGMFVFNINNPDNPAQVGQFSHVFSCDPVIADDDYAYVTLRSGTTCRGGVNQMDVLKLNTLTNPTLLKSYPMTNPHGLSKDGDLLLVCDGIGGLKLYNADNPLNLQLLHTVTGPETYDVIAIDGVALVVAKDGLYQYRYTNPASPQFLSKITIQN
jgi:hypothetical protein